MEKEVEEALATLIRYFGARSMVNAGCSQVEPSVEMFNKDRVVPWPGDMLKTIKFDRGYYDITIAHTGR